MGGCLTTMEAEWAGNRRRAMGGVPRARRAWEMGGVSGRKSGRGRELTAGNSSPQDLSTVSWDNQTNRDVVQHVTVVSSAVGAVPTSPAVEFREVGAGAGFDRQSSTTTTHFGLPSSWEALPVVVFVFGAVRPRSHAQIRSSSPLSENGGRARSRR